MRNKLKAFEDRGAQLLVIDPHEAYRVRHLLRSVESKPDAIAFPILADPAATVSATYGVAFQMNIHTEWSNRPATFIIDREGVIRFERRAKRVTDRPSPYLLLQELDKLGGREGKTP